MKENTLRLFGHVQRREWTGNMNIKMELGDLQRHRKWLGGKSRKRYEKSKLTNWHCRKSKRINKKHRTTIKADRLVHVVDPILWY